MTAEQKKSQSRFQFSTRRSDLDRYADNLPINVKDRGEEALNVRQHQKCGGGLRIIKKKLGNA